MTTEFAQKVADTAHAEWTKFEFSDDDHAQPLKGRVEQYFRETTGYHFTGTEPWGATFVSWCVKSAGATSQEFPFAPAGSVMVHHVINHPGAYRGVRFDAEPPEPGDIIQYSRGEPKPDFEYAKENRQYQSHVMIVFEVDKDDAGPYAIAVKGNDSHRLRRVRITLTKDGVIEQGTGNHFVALLKCVK